MDIQYTSKDIIEMAIQAKARGVDLYLALARNSENYHVGKLFTEFAKDEQKHKVQLEKILDSVRGKKEEAYPGERAMYLRSLVDTNTFNCDKTRKQLLETTVSEEDALRAGITFEKDLMLFLHELRQHADAQGARTIDDLLDEEINHLAKMFHFREKVDGKS
ncbi:MAG: ferritin family protein [Candidatus Omnitrophica bacterium]|nr:ferritin family protein [Candidatus Omnitrophota bacterium]MDD5488594.1 ferritin family protein [Candidatus Omnitrophota bacterium]